MNKPTRNTKPVVDCKQVIKCLEQLDKVSFNKFFAGADFQKVTVPIANTLGVGHSAHCIWQELESRKCVKKDKDQLAGYVKDLMESLSNFLKRIEK